MKQSEQGKIAEAAAESYLTRQGLLAIDRNYRCRSGEIDLIMRDGKQLVFVEVRYRRNTQYGSPLESVDHRKQSRLVKAAEHYLQRHGMTNCRFDVIGITGNQQIQWIQNAF